MPRCPWVVGVGAESIPGMVWNCTRDAKLLLSEVFYLFTGNPHVWNKIAVYDMVKKHVVSSNPKLPSGEHSDTKSPISNVAKRPKKWSPLLDFSDVISF